MKPGLAIILAVSLFSRVTFAGNSDGAARTTNQVGIDLYRQIASKENLCISPYSITAGLAMTLAGAEGTTRTEMLRVLHLEETTEIDPSFQALRQALNELVTRPAEMAKSAKVKGGSSEPIVLAAANRLFPQSGYQFRPEFISRLQEFYDAPPEALDFKQDGAAATQRINDWMAEQTRDRIQNLIPSPLEDTTRLVLANALYLKAPWTNPFPEEATKPEPFLLADGKKADVPTMEVVKSFGYEKRKDHTAITLPYIGGELQLVVLLPNELNGLAALEKQLSAELLGGCAQLPQMELDLHMPKFKFEPPTIRLADELRRLGMKTAFDDPAGSANFDRMAPRKPDDYLAISEVFHKTFIVVDEKGTEAAAATAVVTRTLTAAVQEAEPIEVKIDRPFLYAIQHVPSGACLFLGRVSDPR